MKIYSNTLNVERFKKDFSKLYSEAKRLCRREWSYPDVDSLLDDILQRIEEVKGNISSFLKNLDSLDDSKVQIWCRHASIAQMFNADLNYKDGRPYIEISHYSNDVILIHFDEKANYTTGIVSKYGEIIFHEGKIWTHDGQNYGFGFPIMDMSNNRKVGFITNSGVRVLPCEFDYYDYFAPSLYDTAYECPIMIYGIWSYELRRVSEDTLISISKNDLEIIIKMYDSKSIYFLSEDSNLYKLKPQEHFTRDENRNVHKEFLSRLDCDRSVQEEAAVEANGHANITIEEAHNAIKSFLSECSISKEKLQELLDSK